MVEATVGLRRAPRTSATRIAYCTNVQVPPTSRKRSALPTTGRAPGAHFARTAGSSVSGGTGIVEFCIACRSGLGPHRPRRRVPVTDETAREASQGNGCEHGENGYQRYAVPGLRVDGRVHRDRVADEQQ